MCGSVPDRNRIARRCGAFLILLLLPACAYSFSSGLPGHIKSVAVPLFTNETEEFGVAEEITDRLVSSLVRDGTLRVVVDENDADSVILGTVRIYSEEPFSYDSSEQVDQYIIRITTEVRFQDRVRDEVLWESSRVFASATYSNEGPAERAIGLGDAIDLLVEEVLTGIVAGW
ncbi:LptE family protein [Gemmatimonadota bacterium]